MPAAALPVEQFDLRSFEPADRAEGWRDVLAATHLPWDTSSGGVDAEEPSAWVRRVAFGETAVVDCGCDPCSGVRGRREIESTPGEFIGVLMNRQGREVLAQDGRSAELTPRRRLARAHAELSRRDDLSITEVAFRWGFVDSGHFARVFKRAYGISPRQVREQQPA